VQATQAKRPLARIWKVIAHATDGDIQSIVESGALVWMPAHQTLAMVGERKLSDGARLTAIDWRANRLADALAKAAAAQRKLPKTIEVLLDSAVEAVKHAASQLALVTHAANNHVVEGLDADGKVVRRTHRDATQAPRTYKKKAAPAQPPSPKPAPKPATAKPWTEAPLPHAGKVRRARERALASEQLRRRVEDIASTTRVSGRLGSAAQRMQELQARVRSKL
jgi:chemotaxis protein histidine kinase CheA